MEAINLDDLKLIYKHLQIEEFKSSENSSDYAEFFACFNKDGNLEAHRLIYLAALFAGNCIKIEEIKVDRFGKEYFMEELVYNKTIEFYFDSTDYDGYNQDREGVIGLTGTVYSNNLLELKAILTKYNFIKPIS